MNNICCYDYVLKYSENAFPLPFSLTGPWDYWYFGYIVLWDKAYDIYKEEVNSICNIKEAWRVEAFLELSKLLQSQK